MNYWLMKSEPSCFSIEDLEKQTKQISPWDGVRNYQARNFLQQMQVGDLAFFYHSSCKPPGIVGIIEIVRAAYPDNTALNPLSEHYDAKSTTTNPRWYMVDVKLKHKFSSIISLTQLKQHPQLDKMQILKKGNRLSITPVKKAEWEVICTTITDVRLP